MSSILDALRKIEREEGEHGQFPFDVEEEPLGPGPWRWAIPAAAGAVLLTGTVAGLLWLTGDGPLTALDWVKGTREVRIAANDRARNPPVIGPAVDDDEQRPTAIVIDPEPAAVGPSPQAAAAPQDQAPQPDVAPPPAPLALAPRPEPAAVGPSPQTAPVPQDQAPQPDVAPPPAPLALAPRPEPAAVGPSPQAAAVAADLEPSGVPDDDLAPSAEPIQTAAVAPGELAHGPVAAQGNVQTPEAAVPTPNVVAASPPARDEHRPVSAAPHGRDSTDVASTTPVRPSEPGDGVIARDEATHAMAGTPAAPQEPPSVPGPRAADRPAQLASARTETATAGDQAAASVGREALAATPTQSAAPARAWQRPLASRRPAAGVQDRKNADEAEDRVREEIKTAALTRDFMLPDAKEEASALRQPEMLDEETPSDELSAPDSVAPEAAEEPPAVEQESTPREEVLRRPPRGAPRVSVSFLYYSADPGRRRVMLTVNDSTELHTLYEGQTVESFEVARILPDQIHLRYEGKLFAVKPRYR